MVRYFLLWVLAMVLLGGPVVAQDTADSSDFEILGTFENLPFSEAVRVGKILFLSGQIGYDFDTGELVEGGIQPETRKALENIRNVVEKYGSNMDRVARCDIKLADISEWSSMNEVYNMFFPIHKPARSASAGTGLPLNARVEIECIAVVE